VRADFSRAQKVTDFEIKSKEEEEPDDGEALVEEFSAKRVPNVAADALHKGVKVRGKYVARHKLITAAIIVVVAIIAITLFAPPIFVANDSESSCRYEDIFAGIGATKYKSQLVENHYIYKDIDESMTSDRSESYRICTVAFDAKNYSPFQVTLDDYIVAGGGDYESHIVYSTYVGDSNVIPAFSTKTVRVEILINCDGLSDSEFDKAITSVTLRTKGTKKRIGKNTGIPCVPAWLNVSDVITFDPDL
jgi:hypothetical protein